MRVLLIAAVACGLAYGCAAPVREEAGIAGQRPADFPERIYRQAAAEGRPVFRVDPSASMVVIEVRRAGSLARLGHDHVVASHDVQGYVLPDAGRADLYVALDDLVVDEPGLRKDAGFDTDPGEEAIAATRRNMLERTLETQRYPFASIGVRGVDDGQVEVSITLHGATHTMRVPIQVEGDLDGVEVTGRLSLLQTDFGIVPLAILGGAIQVQDRIDLRFRIVAGRLR